MSCQSIADIKKTLHMISALPHYAVNPHDLMKFFSEASACPDHCHRPGRGSQNLELSSKIISDKDKFQALLEVRQFAPDEITVKVVGDQIVVEGKHEEIEDEHGSISRHFVRKYHLPAGHRAEDVVSALSSDGVLVVTAPKKAELADGERLVPVMATGLAHHAVLNRSKDAHTN